jgi:hypothetical protein
LITWNFSAEDGEFIIWNKKSRVSVKEELNAVAKVDAIEVYVGVPLPMIHVVIKKISI